MRFGKYRSILLIILLAGLSVLPLAVNAHPPSSMDISYDTDDQTLNVTISHGVSNVDSHYIERLEVRKNDSVYLSRDYTSQPSTSTFTYSLDVPATEGDTLSVTAICNQYGSLQKTLVVNGETTGNGDTDGFEFLLLCMAAGIGLLLYTTKK